MIRIKEILLTLLGITLSLSMIEASGTVLRDPGVPDGEQIVWRWTNSDDDQVLSILTWNISNKDKKPVYEITLNSGERKQAKYIIDKTDLRLIYAKASEIVKDGKFEFVVEAKNGYQYLVQSLNNKRKTREIEHFPDGYNGTILPFSLRGFPFGKSSQVELRITPPFKPNVPLWSLKMWKSHIESLGEEKVTVPAGTFDCYKLGVTASGGIIKHFVSEYYFWFAKEPPHHFVKYQDKEGKDITELMEIRSKGKLLETQ